MGCRLVHFLLDHLDVSIDDAFPLFGIEASRNILAIAHCRIHVQQLGRLIVAKRLNDGDRGHSWLVKRFTVHCMRAFLCAIAL